VRGADAWDSRRAISRHGTDYCGRDERRNVSRKENVVVFFLLFSGAVLLIIVAVALLIGYFS